MRGNYIALAAASMMVLASCGSKKLSLSNDPIDKAATCAVVSAADARLKAPDGKGDLDFEAQTRIIHYAMLAGAQGQDFSAARASAVVTRMNALQEDITSNKWKDLIEPCDRAYPVVKKTAGIELPKNRFDAALGCASMGDFLVKTVSSNDPRSIDRFSSFIRMKRDLDGSIGSGLKARGAGNAEKTQALKEAALVRMTKLGAPAAVMNICTGHFT